MKKMLKRTLSAFCAGVLSAAMLSGCAAEPAPQPGTTADGGGSEAETAAASGEEEKLSEFNRSETLYMFAGMGSVPNTFNPLDGNPSWPFARLQQNLLYETLMAMNLVTGELEPLVADGYTVHDDYSIEVKINGNAAFNDGSKLTAEDAKYSIDLGNRYAIGWSSYWNYLDSVEAVDDTTLLIHQKADNPNTMQTLDMLQVVPILPKAIWEKVEEDAGHDIAGIRKFTNMESPVASGPYMLYSYNDQSIVIKRNDDYWGVARFGKLPAPKYIYHPIYKSNDAALQDFKDNKLDFVQIFIPKIWELMENNDKIITYLDEPPYYLPGGITGLIFNVHVPGLDNPEVRRAIAHAVNYDQINEIAMSGYSAKMEAMLCLPGGVEDKYVDKAALADLQWKYDPDKANAILDELGAARGADGIRVLPDGTRMSWELESAYGWTDWNATCEIVAQNAKAVGIELKPTTPESAVYTSNRQTGNFQITMQTVGEGCRPSQPWYRYKSVLYDKDIPAMGELAVSNEGRYHNDRANEIIDQIPFVEDEAELKRLHTEINRIFLEDCPVIPMFYRPLQFYEANETYWKDFPRQSDGKNNPPTFDRMIGVKTFFEINPVTQQ